VDYIYLVASLPRLELTGAPPISSAALLVAGDGILRPDHWEDLRAIVEDRPQDVVAPEGRRLVDEESRLRAALARARAQRAGAELPAMTHRQAEYDPRAAEVAARAMALEDPLERELALARHRWASLDAAATFPAFGVQAVFAYALKLRLAEKWTAMSDEAGLDAAHRVVDKNIAGCGL